MHDDRIRELNKKLPMFIWCQTTHEDLKEYRDESEKTRDLVDDIIREMNIDSTYNRDNVCLQAIEKKPYHRTLQNNPVVATSTLQLDPWEVPEDYEDDAAFGFWNFFHGKKPPATCDASTPPTNGAVGDCTDKLASGSSCQPTCNDGFDVDGATLCVAGVLNPRSVLKSATIQGTRVKTATGPTTRPMTETGTGPMMPLNNLIYSHMIEYDSRCAHRGAHRRIHLLGSNQARENDVS